MVAALVSGVGVGAGVSAAGSRPGGAGAGVVRAEGAVDGAVLVQALKVKIVRAPSSAAAEPRLPDARSVALVGGAAWRALIEPGLHVPEQASRQVAQVDTTTVFGM